MKMSASIIIPAYDNASTINRTLSSVSAQSRGDWEAIIACDGPMDGTVRIARLAAERDPRFTVLDLDHAGVSHARNAAIAASRGEWLMFLDADDTIDPNFLSHMLRVTRRHPKAGIIACGYDRLDELGKISARFAPLPLSDDALAVCAAGPPGAIHSFLVKRELIVAANGFDESLQTNEDWDLWLRLAANGARFATTRKRLAHYWSTPNSLSRNGGQMIRDSGIVQLRAKAMNVTPARGLEKFDHRSFTIHELALRNAFWSAGVAIGQGHPAPNLFGEISSDVDYRYQKMQLATKLFEGLVVGTGTGYDALGLRWLAIREGVNVLLEALRAHVGDRETMYPIAQALQTEIARAGRFRDEIDLGSVIGVSLTVRMLLFGYVPRSDADLIVFRAYWLKPATMFSFATPSFGAMTGRDVRAAVLHGIKRRIATRGMKSRKVLSVLALHGRAMALARRAIGGKRREPPGFYLSSAGRAEADRIAASFALPPIAAMPARPRPVETVHPGTSSGAAEWDSFFANEDPWDYGSPYEQTKYQRTISLISPVPNGQALEIACAEGRFTEMLARIVGSVHAIDISTMAMERAARRTADQKNIDFEQRDVFAEGIGGSWDVITCSEVLYFVPSREALSALAVAIAGALRPGGQFVHAHAFELNDSPGRTAFEWDDTVGADSIFTTFRDTPGLRHARSIVTDLYRIDLFTRDDGDSAAVIEALDIGHPPEPAVGASVVWNGAVVSRSAAAVERVFAVPVLLYNGVAGDDREADPYKVTPHQLDHQLRFLRRRGYRSISPEEWQDGAAKAGSLRGKPLMLTFDDCTADFVKHIWPIIQRNGFLAHLFITPHSFSADNADGCDPAAIAALIDAGVTFGSSLSRERAADQLRSADLLKVAIESRLALEALLGKRVTTVAPPCGFNDIRIETVLATAGYQRSFLGEGGVAPICGYEMRTPRIEIVGETSIDDFARLLARSETPDLLDRP